MHDEKKAFSVEIEEKNLTYYRFFEDDFKQSEKRAEEFVAKGIQFSAFIYDREDLVELIRWDENSGQIIYILTSYGKFKGYEIIEPK